MRYIGIDHGSKGAIASINEHSEILQLTRMPLTESGEVDALGIMIWLSDEAILAGDEDELVVYGEKLHSIFGSSAKSNFQFGINIGTAKGAIACAEIDYYEVRAVDWQSAIFEIAWVWDVNMEERSVTCTSVPEMSTWKRGKLRRDTKAMASFAVDALWPTYERTNLTDGECDALLIAEYARRTHKEN